MSLGVSVYRNPYSSFAGADPRFGAIQDFAAMRMMQPQGGMPFGSPFGAQGADQFMNRMIAQFMLGALMQQQQQQQMQDMQMLVSLMAMAMMLGQAMNGQGSRQLGSQMGQSGNWGNQGRVDNGSWGRTNPNGPSGPGYDPRTGPVGPMGEMPGGSATGQRLAQAGLQAANRRRTVGRCYAGVKEAVRNATGVQLTGGSAYQAADQLARSPQFREVRVSPDQLRNLPPGAIVVWGRTNVSPHGHISIATGDGREASDHVQRQMTSLRGHQNFRVFVPADSQGATTQPNGMRADNRAGMPPLSGRQYTARGTGYYPDNSAMEGGYRDRRGAPLHTLQDYLAGRAPYVSVAMDSNAARYGTRVRIPELEARYGRPIDFRVVDTGGAFRGRGTSRIDICTANRRASLDPTVNGPLTLIF